MFNRLSFTYTAPVKFAIAVPLSPVELLNVDMALLFTTRFARFEQLANGVVNAVVGVPVMNVVRAVQF